MLIRSPAQLSPAGPLPTMATFLPFLSIRGISDVIPFDISKSATNRSRRPIDTGSNLLASTHLTSHWVSWGQTRPQIAGRTLSSFIFRAAPRKSSSTTNSRKSIILISTGQPSIQVGFLHCRQRWASKIACSLVKPRLTSSKLCARISGSCSGINWRGSFVRSFGGRNSAITISNN